MLIAQISDTHISAPGTLAYGVAPTADRLAKSVAHINQQNPKPECVLVTGDISNTGDIRELQQAKGLLDALTIPYYVIPGNHDDRTKVWTVFSGRSCPGRSAGFINYVVDHLAVRLIALDTVMHGEAGGEVCKTRADWLDARLSENTTKPTVIFMHHPPVKCGVIETDIDGFKGADRLSTVIKKYTHIEKIVCGHIHLDANTRWCGTMISTAPSTGMQLVLDLSLEQEAFTLGSPAYQLHYWTQDKNLITHTVEVDAGEGPFPFKEPVSNSGN